MGKTKQTLEPPSALKVGAALDVLAGILFNQGLISEVGAEAMREAFFTSNEELLSSWEEATAVYERDSTNDN